VSIITGPEKVRTTDTPESPDYFTLTLSQSGKRNYVKVPRLRLTVGNTTLDSLLALTDSHIPFSDPDVADELVDWLDDMIDYDKHLPPPFEPSFLQKLMEPNA